VNDYVTLLLPPLVPLLLLPLEYVTTLRRLVTNFEGIKKVRYWHFVSVELEAVANAPSEPMLD
jgi:uncharacterized membrane protein